MKRAELIEGFSEVEGAEGLAIEKEARLFYTGRHKGRDYTGADLASIADAFTAPAGADDWTVPVQLDHSDSARDTITEAAVARATEAALGRVAAIVGPALERIERATAALSPDRITLRHPSGAAIEIGFSDRGFPRITLRDTTGAGRLKMGLGMYNDDPEIATEAIEGEPLTCEPEIEMREPDGSVTLAMAAGNGNAQLHVRRCGLDLDLVPTTAKMIADEMHLALTTGGGAWLPHVLQKLFRHEIRGQAKTAPAWGAKMAAMLAVLESPLP